MLIEQLTAPQFVAERKALGYSQARLAARWGYSRRTLTEWENGRVPLPRWVRDALAGIRAEHACQ